MLLIDSINNTLERLKEQSLILLSCLDRRGGGLGREAAEWLLRSVCADKILTKRVFASYSVGDYGAYQERPYNVRMGRGGDRMPEPKKTIRGALCGVGRRWLCRVASELFGLSVICLEWGDWLLNKRKDYDDCGS